MNRIYLDHEASEHFDVTYTFNRDMDTVINASSLFNYMEKRGTLDTHHKDLISKHIGTDLILKGDMFGWWFIKN